MNDLDCLNRAAEEAFARGRRQGQDQARRQARRDARRERARARELIRPRWDDDRVGEAIAAELGARLAHLAAARRTWIEPRDDGWLMSIAWGHSGIRAFLRLPNEAGAGHSLLHMDFDQAGGIAGMWERGLHRLMGEARFVQLRSRQILARIARGEGRHCHERGLPPAPGLAARIEADAIEASCAAPGAASAARPGL